MFWMEPLIAASIGFAFQNLKLGGASIAMPPLGWPPVQKRGCFFNPSSAFQLILKIQVVEFCKIYLEFTYLLSALRCCQQHQGECRPPSIQCQQHRPMVAIRNQEYEGPVRLSPSWKRHTYPGMFLCPQPSWEWFCTYTGWFLDQVLQSLQ